MKNTLRILACIFLLCWTALLQNTRAAVVLSDSFDGASLDTNAWVVAEPFFDSDMYASNGVAVFLNSGRLLTQANVPNAIQIEGRFKFMGSDNDAFRIYVRTDGDANDPYGRFVNGVEVIFSFREGDNGTIGSNNVLMGIPLVTELGTRTNFLFQTNVFYDFRITDDGTNLSLFLGNLTTPLLERSTTTRAGNRVGIHNHTGLGTIADGSLVHLDYITVTEIPAGLNIYHAVELEFFTRFGRTYQVQSSDDMGTWVDLGAPVVGTGEVVELTYPTRQHPKRFFRLQDITPP